MDPQFDKHLIKRRDRLYFRARKSSHTDIKSHYKRFRAHVQKIIRDAYWKRIALIPIVHEKMRRRKGFGNLSSLSRKTCLESLHQEKNGILKTDTLDKANICNRQFESAFTCESDTEIPSKGTSPFIPWVKSQLTLKGS